MSHGGGHVRASLAQTGSKPPPVVSVEPVQSGSTVQCGRDLTG